MSVKDNPSQRVETESYEEFLTQEKKAVRENLEKLDEILPLASDQLNYFWDKLYPEYFQKFEFRTGFFEVDGSEIQFVDRSLGKEGVALIGTMSR
ncbi:hypothetical protein HC823_01860 [Candidatus Gracilibacteria bacterium]|nr:hypothetical protein [Candidatus Gracilibacteria bacterium]